MFNIFKTKQKRNHKIEETMKNIVTNLEAINNNQKNLMKTKKSEGYQFNNNSELNNIPKSVNLTDNETIKEAIKEVKTKASKSKNNFNFKLLLIPIIPSLILLIALYNTKMPSIDLEPLKLSNQDIVIKTKSNPFFAKVKESKQSQLIEGFNVVNLGKIEGSNKLIIGGILDLGFIKLNGLNTNEFIVKRDYSSVDYTTDIAKYYDNTKPVINFKFANKERNFKLYINNELLYGGDLKEPKCKELEDNLSCEVDFGLESKKNIEFKLVDNSGNINISDVQVIENVEPISFVCDKKFLINDGKLKCKSNYDGTLKYKDIDYPVTKDNELVLEEVYDDGPIKLDLIFTSSYGFKKDIVIEANINKQNNLIDFKTSVIENLNGVKGQIVTLNATTGNDANLDLSQSYYINPVNGSVYPIKKILNMEVVKKESNTIFSDLFNSNSQKLNTVIRITMTNKSFITTNYKCSKEYNQLEFVCIKL